MVKFSKGNNSVNNVGGVMVSVLCTSADDPLYLYKVSVTGESMCTKYWLTA